MPISYTKRGWTNNSPPAINAANLGAMDDGLKNAVDALNNMGDAGQQVVKEIGEAPASTTGGKLVNKITEVGYSLAPATGADNLDNIADGESYKRVQAAQADAINNETRLPTALGAADANLIGALSKIANAKLFVNAAGNGFEYNKGVKLLTATWDMATASGSQAITGVGFKPSALIIFADISITAQASWGFGDASVRAAIYAYGGNFNDSNGVVVYLKTNDSNYNYATIASIDSDGFTLNWTKVGSQTGTAYMKILAIR